MIVLGNNPAPAGSSSINTPPTAVPESASATSDFSAALTGLFNDAAQPADASSTSSGPEHTGKRQKDNSPLDPASPLPSGAAQIFAAQTVPATVPSQPAPVPAPWDLVSMQAAAQSMSAQNSGAASAVQGSVDVQSAGVSDTVSPVPGHSSFVAVPAQAGRTTSSKTSIDSSSGDASPVKEAGAPESSSAVLPANAPISFPQQQVSPSLQNAWQTSTSTVARAAVSMQETPTGTQNDTATGVNRSASSSIPVGTAASRDVRSTSQTSSPDQSGSTGLTSVAADAPLPIAGVLTNQPNETNSSSVNDGVFADTASDTSGATMATSPDQISLPEMQKTEGPAASGGAQDANGETKPTTGQPPIANPAQSPLAPLLQPAVQTAPSATNAESTSSPTALKLQLIGLPASAPVQTSQPGTVVAVNVNNRVVNRRGSLQTEAPLTRPAPVEQVTSAAAHAAPSTNKSDLTKDTASESKTGADDASARALSDAPPIPVLPPSASMQTVPGVMLSSSPHVPDASSAQAPAPTKDSQGALPSLAPDGAAPVHTSMPPGSPYSAVSTSRLIQTLGQSEMRVGLRSSEFGDISIRTSTTADDLSAQISLSHEDLAKSLTAHIPDMQAKIGTNIGFEITVNSADRNTGTTSSLSDMGAGSQGSRQQGENTGSPLSRYLSGSATGQSLPAVTLAIAARNATRDGRIDLQA